MAQLERQPSSEYARALSVRLAHTPSHVGLSYARSAEGPLLLCASSGCYLLDERGRRFLDCVNNVAHVGHAHPAVVQAAAQQLSAVNTNTVARTHSPTHIHRHTHAGTHSAERRAEALTQSRAVRCCAVSVSVSVWWPVQRYLSSAVSEFMSALLSTFPASFDAVYLCNSGSEANDLALRLARAYTGDARAVFVHDCAYHGHTAATVALSPYKYSHQSQGRIAAPRNTHALATPDIRKWRAAHIGHGDADAEDAAAAFYADELKQRIAGQQRDGGVERSPSLRAAQCCADSSVCPLCAAALLHSAAFVRAAAVCVLLRGAAELRRTAAAAARVSAALLRSRA